MNLIIQNVQLHRNRFRLLDDNSNIYGYLTITKNSYVLYKECSLPFYYQCATLTHTGHNDIWSYNLDSRHGWNGQDLNADKSYFTKCNNILIGHLLKCA
jgi:hypothetical protein